MPVPYKDIFFPTGLWWKKGLELLVALGTLLNSNFNTFSLKNTNKLIFFIMVVTMFEMKNKSDFCCAVIFQYISKKKKKKEANTFPTHILPIQMFLLCAGGWIVTSQLKLLNEKIEASKRIWRKSSLQ